MNYFIEKQSIEDWPKDKRISLQVLIYISTYKMEKEWQTDQTQVE